MSLFDRLLRVWRAAPPAPAPRAAVPSPEPVTPPVDIAKAPPVLAKIGSAGQPYPAIAALVAQFEDAAAPADNLVLGDSVMERVAKEDTDRRTLGTMIADERAGERTVILSASANNPLVYRGMLTMLMRLRHRPKRIVLPVNLRCFSPQWHLNPDWTMVQEIELLSAFAQTDFREFPPIADVYRDDAAHAALAGMPLDLPLSRRRTMGEFRALAGEPKSEDRNREIFIFHYTHALQADHPKLAALKDAAALAAALASEVLLYVTPINVEAAERFVGSAFRDAVRANVAKLNVALPLPIHDWHDTLPDDAFFHGDTATEHLNQTGRSALAKMVSAAIQRHGATDA